MNATGIRLTELSSCAGCAAKLGAAELRSVMERVAPATDERVLVGYGSSDDAGVYLLRDDLALVEDLDHDRVRILTQETQKGKPAEELAKARPNPMINGHQEWLDGRVAAAGQKTGKYQGHLA